MAEQEPAGMPVLPGKLRPGFQPLYVEIRDYAPLIGGDALALYSLFLTFRHGGGLIESLTASAWPGDRTLCRLLNWSRGANVGAPSRLARALATLEAARLVEITTLGQLLTERKITPQQAEVLAPRTSAEFRRKKRVCLVNDPLEKKELLPVLSDLAAAIEQRLEELRVETAARSKKLRQERAAKKRRREDQAAAPQAAGGGGKQLELLVPADNGRVALETALLDYGVTDGDKLTSLLADPLVTLTNARAWMYHLDSDARLTPESRVSILICRLEDHSRPPRKWLPLAALTPDQEAWLEEHADTLGWSLRLIDWAEIEETVGVTLKTAQLWRELVKADAAKR